MYTYLETRGCMYTYPPALRVHITPRCSVPRAHSTSTSPSTAPSPTACASNGLSASTIVEAEGGREGRTEGGREGGMDEGREGGERGREEVSEMERCAGTSSADPPPPAPPPLARARALSLSCSLSLTHTRVYIHINQFPIWHAVPKGGGGGGDVMDP